MKYGFIPTTVAERLALWAGRIPLPVLDSVYALMKSRCLMAAVRLGVFDALAKRGMTAGEVAAARGLDAGTLELLLRSLVANDYLVQSGDRFELSPVSRRSLVAGAPAELRGFVLWNYTQWRMTEHLEELLRTGRGLDFHHTMVDPESWRHYQEAMLQAARFDAPLVAARVPVRRGARRVLDLAGAHGLFGAEICRRHPGMSSLVIELPAALEHARALAREAGIDDCVEHRAGDLLRAELEGGCDVALLCNILHHFDPATIEVILARVRAALSPGGTVAVWEVERPDRRSRPGFGDGAALFFRLTSTAGCYTGAEYRGWLDRAGLGRTRIVRPFASPGNVLVIGRG